MFMTPLRKFGYKYYEIEKLASDGCSDIYSVQKLDSGIFALKLFKKGFSEEKFAKQIKIYSLLGQEGSPFFLQYISNSKDESIVREKYIVLEFVEKGELKNYILSGKFFPEKLAKIAVYKILDGISEMHKMGIVHKKISIENIFLDRFYNFKIGDFGCAEFVGGDQKHLFTEDILDAGMVIIQLLTGKFELKIIRDKLKTAIIKLK
jgi:serine/threonine protein kinase